MLLPVYAYALARSALSGRLDRRLGTPLLLPLAPTLSPTPTPALTRTRTLTLAPGLPLTLTPTKVLPPRGCARLS